VSLVIEATAKIRASPGKAGSGFNRKIPSIKRHYRK
jgi:hypothetical protein